MIIRRVLRYEAVCASRKISANDRPAPQLGGFTTTGAGGSSSSTTASAGAAFTGTRFSFLATAGLGGGVERALVTIGATSVFLSAAAYPIFLAPASVLEDAVVAVEALSEPILIDLTWSSSSSMSFFWLSTGVVSHSTLLSWRVGKSSTPSEGGTGAIAFFLDGVDAGEGLGLAALVALSLPLALLEPLLLFFCFLFCPLLLFPGLLLLLLLLPELLSRFPVFLLLLFPFELLCTSVLPFLLLFFLRLLLFFFLRCCCCPLEVWFLFEDNESACHVYMSGAGSINAAADVTLDFIRA